MPTIDRRDLLRLVGGGGLLAVLPAAAGCDDDAPRPAGDAAADASSDAANDATSDATSDGGGESPPPEGFAHGVASGDPLPDAVILWTRISPRMPAPVTVEVQWELSTTRDFTAVARMGSFSTGPERDYTVKVDVTGLQPGMTYFYRFRALGFTSPVGRTKTAAAGAVARAKFAVVSCSNLAFGYFHVYRNLATRDDLDAVLHLGDYIYEYGNNEYGSLRANVPPREVFTLADYRARYAQYRREAELQAVHAALNFHRVIPLHRRRACFRVDGR